MERLSPARLGAALLVSAIAVACGGAHDDVRTVNMNASIGAIDDGHDVAVYVSFYDGDPMAGAAPVAISDGDSIVATYGANEVVLSPLVSDPPLYSALLPSAVADGTELRVRLDRRADVAAPANRCTFPAAVAITSPADRSSFSRSRTDLAITWQPVPSGGGDTVTVGLDGECVASVDKDVADSGQFVVPSRSTEPLVVRSSTPTSCDATVTVMRGRTGTLDPAFGKGGSIDCSRVQHVTVRSNP